LPSFLEEGRHYAHGDVLNFTSLYYLCTDIGCLAAGGVSLWLVRRWRMTAHVAKRRVYLVCALMTCGSLAIPWLSHGNLLLAMILFIGAGALGLFPCYYGFVQELSPTNVARVTGIMSFWVWIVTSPMHSAFGHLVDQTKSFDLGMAFAGLAPLLGVAALALLWPVKAARASA
jgi:ACS family hexuronate transporter-like MFS transporter